MQNGSSLPAADAEVKGGDPVNPKYLGLEVYGPTQDSLVQVKAIADEICARVRVFPTKTGWTLRITEYNIEKHGKRLIDKAKKLNLGWNEISSSETTQEEVCSNAGRETAVRQAA